MVADSLRISTFIRPAARWRSTTSDSGISDGVSSGSVVVLLPVASDHHALICRDTSLLRHHSAGRAGPQVGPPTQNMLAFAEQLRSNGAGLRMLNLGGRNFDFLDLLIRNALLRIDAGEPINPGT